MEYHQTPLSDWTEAMFRTLIADSVPESRHLDYKRELPGRTNAEKGEFVADIVSFANSGGGTLLYGVDEENGRAHELVGLDVDNEDVEQQRLEQMIQSGTAPRVPGVRFRWIPLQAGQPVLMIRVPRSWSGPHMVDRGSSRFYARNGSGKYPLDVTQIRSAFLASHGVQSRMAEFRADRMAKIVAGGASVSLREEKLYVLHLVPLEAFADGAPRHYAQAAADARSWKPLGASGFNERWNLDGIVFFAGHSDSARAYTQVFHAGAVEAVDRLHCSSEHPLDAADTEQLIAGSIEGYARLLREAGCENPLLAQVSLIGVKGIHLGRHYEESPSFDRDMIYVPGELLSEDDMTSPIRRIVDTVWQAAGYRKSPFALPGGAWQPGGGRQARRRVL